MICEVCRESVATVHLTEIVNNNKQELHLCESCAQEKGVAIHSQVKNLNIPEFFGQLAEPGGGTETSASGQCPQCGISYTQFRSSGKLGCPRDYQVFREELGQLLEKIHSGSTQHRGKVPSRVGRQFSVERELVELREELDQAVEAELYEHAAEIRDRIHDLEREEHCS